MLLCDFQYLLQFKPGPGVSMGKDYTIFATQPGIVVYQKNKYIKKVTCS